MERMGYFSTDVSEPAQAYEEQVLVKKLFGAPEGLEIVSAPMGTAGRQSGMSVRIGGVRLDIPTLWRALVQRPAGKGQGPMVAILAPRGTAPSEAAPKLTAAGVTATSMEADPERLHCALPAGTAPADVINFGVAALNAIGGLMPSPGWWQWTVRAKGTVPR